MSGFVSNSYLINSTCFARVEEPEDGLFGRVCFSLLGLTELLILVFVRPQPHGKSLRPSEASISTSSEANRIAGQARPLLQDAVH